LVSRRFGGTATQGCTDNTNPGGNPPSTDNGFSTTPQVSRDGTVVVFSSSCTNLVSGFTRPGTSSQDVFVATKVGGLWTPVLVSHNSGSSTTGANGASGTPAISPDGQFVAFQSTATNMVSQADANAANDVFLFNRSGGAVSLISVTSAGTAAGGNFSEL